MSVAVADENPIWRKMLTDWTKSRSQWVLFAWNIQVWFFFRSKLKTNIRRKTHSSRSQAFITFLFLWFFVAEIVATQAQKFVSFEWSANRTSEQDKALTLRAFSKKLCFFAPIYKIKNWIGIIAAATGTTFKTFTQSMADSYREHTNWTELNSHTKVEKKSRNALGT